MAPIVVPGAIRVTMSGTTGGRPFANVFGGIITGAGTAVGLATDIATAYLDEVLPFLTPSVTIDTARYVDLDTEDGATGPIPGLTLPVSGENTGAAAPQNVCYLVHLNSGGTRTQRNGRSYWPGVLEGAVLDTGLLEGTQLSGLTNQATLFVDGVEAGDNGEVAVISKTGLDSYEARAVAGATGDPRVATQRRRLRR